MIDEGYHKIIEKDTEPHEIGEEEASQMKQEADRSKVYNVRRFITYLFRYKYNGLSNLDGNLMSNLKARGGILAKIRKDLGVTYQSDRNIEKVMVHTLLCEINGTAFGPTDLDTRG